MILAIVIKGSQTKAHCSMSSSICACEKLLHGSGRCKLFKRKLEYDWEEHAYKRCERCIEGEI